MLNSPLLTLDVHYHWLDDPDQLTALCQQWQQLDAIALDTEFVRTDTFYPKPGLIQIATGEQIYLVDPISLGQHQAFKEMLVNDRVTKVVHSCSEDLEVLRCCFGVLPSPVFDTQLAAAFCGHGFSVGYANLVKALFDLVLPKDATRSDWLQRPLGDVQKNYAALDVAHLLLVYRTLVDQLKANGKLQWLLSDCQSLVHSAADTTQVNPDYYLKVKHAWRLRRPELQVLKALCLWREQEARARDVPRNRIFKDAVLYDIALTKPPHLAKLSTVDGVQGKAIREYGSDVLQVIKSALAEPEAHWPQRLPKPLPKPASELSKVLKAQVAQQAEQLDLPTEVLVRKADLQSLLYSIFHYRAPQLSERLAQGWRHQVIGQALLAQAKEYFESQGELNS